jgi:hypothetical protein
MWGLRDLACVMLSGGDLLRFKLIRIAATPSEMSDTCLLLSFRSYSTFIMLILFMRMTLATL